MNNRYSVYDQLNAGRPRRTTASLDDLEATIGGIEARLDKMRGHGTTGSSGYQDEIADRMRMLGNQVAGLGRTAQAAPGMREPKRPHGNQENLAREIERIRREESDQTQIGAIFSELQLLRGEMKRLASGSKQDDWGLALRQEIEAIKHGIGSLAREDTLRSVENRWSEFAQPARGGLENDPVVDTLIDRIDAIQSAVSGLPQSLSIASLEEKIRVLASAIDQMSRRTPEINPQHLMQIEDRLDEISRAIVASSVSVQPINQDKASFERIEARLGALNARLEELATAEPGREVQDRIAGLSRHIEQIAQTAGEPSEHIVRMASQMEAIADKLEQLDSRKADVDAVARAMETRLADLVARLEQPAPDHSGEIFDMVERRFADLSSKIDMVPASSALDAGFADTIERRLSDITQRLNQSTSAPPAIDPAAMSRIEEQVASLSQRLSLQPSAASFSDEVDLRLASIENKLSSNQEELLAAARYAAEEALRTAAVGGLTAGQSETVAQLAADLKSLDMLARKSDDRNSRTFEAIHDTLLKVVERLGSLEIAKPYAPDPVLQPARPSAKIETETFDLPPVAQKSPSKLDLGLATPTFDMDDDGPLEDFSPVPVRSPAEAALAAANAARELAATADPKDAGPGAKGGLFSGLTKALRREAKPSADEHLESPAMRVEPELAGSSPAPSTVELNTSVDQISGAPDLNAIMKRVRDERKGRTATTGDLAAKNDFLAAARRAAQAAAADAEVLKNRNAKAQKAGGSAISELLQRQRKPILMGALAIMLALTGLQLGKAFFSQDVEQAAVTEPMPENTDAAAEKTAALPDLSPQMPAAEPQSGEPMETAPASAAPDQGVRVIEPTAKENAAAPVSPATDAAPMAADAPAMPLPAVTGEDAGKVTAALPSGNPAAIEAVPAEAGPLPLREAAASGDGKALFEIGARYADGRGVAKDAKKAAEWYQKAADAGFAPAQFRLGSLFEKGIGVERAPDKAKTLYQLAAEQGNASAMHNLAVLFAMGAAGPADNDSAAKWFVKAAELGVKDSQYNLGILAAKGLGVPQNLEESYKWFALAAKAGDKDAASKRDEIANAMRPEQLQKARAAAELWKAKTPVAESNAVDVPEAWTSDLSETASTPPPSADMAKAIRNIQIILNQNGYDAGSPDGKLGAKTKKAIAAYQKANAMPATGEVNEALVKSLLKKVKS